MGGRKRIVDVEVAERRQPFCELRVVALLFGVEAHVLQQQYVAVVQGCDGVLRGVADRVVGETHADAEPIGERLSDGAQGEARVAFAVRATEVREDDRTRTLFVKPAQRR